MLKKIGVKIASILPASKFSRSVGVLVGGTAGAQLLTVAASPLLTRLYTPADFGALAIYASLLSLISVIATMRYELAIPLPTEKRDAAKIVILCLCFVAFFSITTTCIVAIWRDPISVLIGEPRLAQYLWFLPLGVLFSGTYNTFNYWAVREQRFSAVATSRIRQALASTFIQLTFFKWGGGSLVFSQVAAQSVGAIPLGRSFFSGFFDWKIKWREIGLTSMRYRKFPIFSTWEGLFNTAGTQLPALLFGAFFSPAAAGLYSLATRVLSLPMSLVGTAIGQVFFASAAEAHRKGKLGELVTQLHGKLAHVGMAPALLLILTGPDLFSFVFGENWRQAGHFARWMTPWLYLVFVSSPLSTLFSVMEQQGRGLIFQIILLISRIFAIYVGILINDVGVAVVLFSTASALCWLGFLIWIGMVTGKVGITMLAPTFRAFCYGMLCAMPSLVVFFVPTSPSNLWMFGLLASLFLLSVRLAYFFRKP